MKKECFKQKNISRSLATLLMIVIAVVASLVTVMFTMGFMGITVDRASPLRVQIISNIYSPESNLGILNENSTFHFKISNTQMNPKMLPSSF
jgi:hypothetical protein